MKFLLTNDDGIDAPGIRALLCAAEQLGKAVVVAPVDAHSGCSHRVTTDAPFCVHRRADQQFAVAGTPADCVRVGLHRIAPGTDWILSGINHGGNLGADVHHSGTVAAVREGVLHGWRGIAISHYLKRDLPLDWERAARWTAKTIEMLLELAPDVGSFWNLNLPHLAPDEPDPSVVFCPLDPSPLPLSFREEGDVYHYNGEYRKRARRPGMDVDVCFSGNISVTQIKLL